MASPLKSREVHDITLADGVLSTTVALAVGDVLDCIPRISYRAQNTPEVTHDSLIVRAQFLTSPNRLQVSRTASDGPLTIKAVVWEFDTSAGITIQTGTVSFSGLTADVTLSAIVLNKAFAVISYEMGSGGDNDNATVRCMTTTTTNLHIERDAQGQTIDLNWWVVEDTSVGGLWDVQRILALSVAGTTADATITSIDMATTMLFATQELNNFGNEPDEWGIVFLFAAVTVRAIRENGAGTMLADVFVVTFTADADVEVQRGVITMAGGDETGTATITTLGDLSRSFSHAPMAPNGCSSDETTNANTGLGFNTLDDGSTVGAGAATDPSTQAVYFEVVEFLAAAPAANQHPVVIGTNF